MVENRCKQHNTIFSKACQIRGSIVASISARHADDAGSIPGRGDEGAIAHMCASPAPVCMVNTYLECVCMRKS